MSLFGVYIQAQRKACLYLCGIIWAICSQYSGICIRGQGSVTGNVLYDTQLFLNYHRRPGGIFN